MGKYRTPLRYPGGKQKLAPFILEILATNGLVGGQYVEPYAGGAGVAIELLLSGKVEKIHLNDSCKAVHAFWSAVIHDGEMLCRRVSRASLTVEEWRRQKAVLARPLEHDRIDLGFSLLYVNRVNRSGILSGGLIGGINQDGPWKMDARFPRNDLISRIELIASYGSKIKVKNWDAERFLIEYVAKLPANSLVYCDPPYFKKADRLYLNHYKAEDHKRISQVVQRELKHPWVVSYDGAPEILAHYSKRRHFLYDLQYNAGKVYKGTEAFFFSDRLKLPESSSLTFISVALGQAA